MLNKTIRSYCFFELNSIAKGIEAGNYTLKTAVTKLITAKAS
ncbi:hypothetical protein [Enterococcus sp. BWB1-3]|nr:hypothetical protein [Enterococcus sp. BWB1-3]